MTTIGEQYDDGRLSKSDLPMSTLDNCMQVLPNDPSANHLQCSNGYPNVATNRTYE